WWVYAHVPSSFLPTEDQGVLMAMVELPEQATMQQTREAVQAVEQYLLDDQGDTVASVFAAVGFSFGGSGQNNAMMFIRLRDYAERPQTSATDLMAMANQAFAGNRYGQIFFLQPPPIPGMGTSSGFSMYLVDRGGNGQQALKGAADQLVAA